MAGYYILRILVREKTSSFLMPLFFISGTMGMAGAQTTLGVVNQIRSIIRGLKGGALIS